MDKVKAAADKAMTEAKKGTAQVKGKIEDAQLRRKADDAAKRLGYLVAKERTEGVPAGEEADQLVQEISALETQIAEESAAAEALEGEEGEQAAEPAAPPAAEAASDTPAEAPPGDFKLE
jgi:hypothetical protein